MTEVLFQYVRGNIFGVFVLKKTHRTPANEAKVVGKVVKIHYNYNTIGTFEVLERPAIPTEQEGVVKNVK